MLGRMPTICVLLSVLTVLFAMDLPVKAQSEVKSDPKSAVEIVLLDNGRVLKGQVMRTADQVHVKTLEGSRIVLAAKRVDVILHSMEEAWQHRSKKLRDDDMQGHLSLFHWCVKHRLKNAARQELNALMLTDIDVRRLRFLDQQIARTFELPEPQSPGKVDSGHPHEDLDTAYTFRPLPPVDSETTLPSDVIVDHAIALASHAEPVSAKNPGSQKVKTAVRPRVKSVRNELDSMTDLLTRDDLHQFQRRIQPVLLKGCLAAKCHHTSSAVMPLMHRGHGQLVPKRFTQRNLQSIVPWIDAENFDSSQLLTRASVAHAGQEKAALEKDSKEFKRLSEWVKAVVENSPELISLLEADQGLTNDAPKPMAVATGLASDAKNQRVVSEAETSLKSRHSDVKHAAKSPADPFDPAAFNQLAE